MQVLQQESFCDAHVNERSVHERAFQAQQTHTVTAFLGVL